MSAYSDHAHDAYLDRVRHTVGRLRDMADRVERAGLDVRPEPKDDGHRPPGGDPHVAAAHRAVHEAVWGLANAGLDTLVSEAGEADRAAREATP